MRNLSAASTKPSVTRKFMTRRFMSSLRILTSRSFRSHSSRVTTFFEDAMEAGESMESRSWSTMRERNIRCGGQGRGVADCWSDHTGAINLQRRAARWRARVSRAGRGQPEDGLRTWEKPRMSTSGDPESPEEKELVVTCNSIQLPTVLSEIFLKKKLPRLWQTRDLIGFHNS